MCPNKKVMKIMCGELNSFLCVYNMLKCTEEILKTMKIIIFYH